MESLSMMVEDLAAADNDLSLAATGDFVELQALLTRRGVLLEAIARRLEQHGQGTDPVAPRQREALEASSLAGARALRQLIVAKHMLASELNQLRQMERLTDAICAGSSHARGRLDIQG